MSNVVLDASAILALLNAEPGADQLTPELLHSAVTSTVNLAEVQSKLVREGVDPDEAWGLALSPVREAVQFTAEQARAAGDLAATTSSLGLSLGDRACLALGVELGAPIYTTDRSWKNVKLTVRIHILR